MNAPVPPLLPEVHVGPQPADQPSLQLASEGAQRYVWRSAYGEVLIEVRNGAAFVNGDRVTSIQELKAASKDASLTSGSSVKSDPLHREA
jgi:uncharacterized Zn ribbon protein